MRERHGRALEQAGLDAARHLAELEGVGGVRQVEPLGPAGGALDHREAVRAAEGRASLQVALRADDAGPARRVGDERDDDLGVRAAAVRQREGAELVDTFVVDVPGRLHACREAEGADHPAERVDGQVQERAAAVHGRPEARAGVALRHEAHVGLHVAHGADLAAPQYVHGGNVGGEEARPDGLHEEQATVAREAREVLGLGRRDGERLLDEDVLARAQHGAGGGVVLAVRGGDVHDVDVRVLRERLVAACAAVRRPEAVLGGEGGGLGGVAAAHGLQARVLQACELRGDRVRDLAGGDDAPAQGGARGGEGVGSSAAGGLRRCRERSGDVAGHA